MCSDRELWTYHPRTPATQRKRGTYVPRYVLYPQSDVEPDDEDLICISESEYSSESEETTGHHHCDTPMPPLRCQLLSGDAAVPVRGSAGAAGYDLSAAHDCLVPAHGKALIKTDVAMAIPDGYYCQIAPRSSLAWKNHIDVGAGVIDSDYRGNIGVILFNHGSTELKVEKGMRIAQIIITKIETPANPGQTSSRICLLWESTNIGPTEHTPQRSVPVTPRSRQNMSFSMYLLLKIQNFKAFQYSLKLWIYSNFFKSQGTIARQTCFGLKQCLPKFSNT